VSHTTASQRVFGPDPNANPARYYFNPANIQSMNLSAVEFDHNMNLQVTSPGPLSAMTTFTTGDGNRMMQVPLSSGIGFISAVYYNLSPVIQSQVGFNSFKQLTSPMPNIMKYEVVLFNNVRWLIYATVQDGQAFGLTMRDTNHLCSTSSCYNTIVQVASCPKDQDRYCDDTAGAYAESAELNGQVDGCIGTYSIKYSPKGRSSSQNLLIFALPHHVESFTSETERRKTSYNLDSTVMGQMTACITTSLDMQESLAKNIGLLPRASFRDRNGSQFDRLSKYSPDILNLLKSTCQAELSQDICTQCNLDSMYFSGKAIDKYAFILLVARYILKDNDLTMQGLHKIKSAFKIFTENRQINPLCYDITWKGLVSVAGLSGDPNADFGNSYYNDHHFHYSYFIHAAGVVGQIDKELGGNWIMENQSWINSIIRDVSNPSKDDIYFPVSRSFDWFVGHSWAKGLFLSGDGKDEESTSEDVHFAYALKIWALATGNEAMEATGDLMMAVMKRSMSKYMLFCDDNDIQPSQVIANRVSGIMFENKIDHATYFGMNPEYVQGIHMIPMTPALSLIRGREFVKQEWDSKVSKFIDSVDSGWKGILMLNKASVDPESSLKFFASPNFKDQWLDGGMSRTWSIAFAAGLC
jgi:endo-1,3(4)-beta-glucanase